MIIDFHGHIGKDLDGGVLNLEDLKKSMDRWKINKTVVFPFSGNHQEMIKESLEILERSKEINWIIPFLRFSPKEILKEELISLLDKDFKGIKLHPKGEDFEVDDQDFLWIYELCEEKSIPILIHSGTDHKGSHPKKILNIARKFPELKIIMAHFFGNGLKIMEEASGYKNLYSDISIHARTLRINQAVYEYSFKRLVFGSDVPYDSQGVALLKINESNLKEEDKELILHKNAEDILNL
jgi:predicted TIM-barrel fold metal-dependent hydrolase